MRHNHSHGEILVLLTNEKLVIQNTGDAGSLAENEIFERFNKSSGSEGTGLGLTLSKQICDNYNYRLKYSFDPPYHTFTIIFNP